MMLIVRVTYLFSFSIVQCAPNTVNLKINIKRCNSNTANLKINKKWFTAQFSLGLGDLDGTTKVRSSSTCQIVIVYWKIKMLGSLLWTLNSRWRKCD